MNNNNDIVEENHDNKVGDLHHSLQTGEQVDESARVIQGSTESRQPYMEGDKTLPFIENSDIRDGSIT